MRYWWVNQNQTYRKEISGGFLWSPKANKNGARNQFYENMREVEPGDIIFSFCDTKIKAVGIAQSTAQTATKPDFGTTGGNWSAEGWLLPTEFREFADPIRPKDHIDRLRPLLPAKYSPLQKNGDGQQSVYLAAVPDTLANTLVEIIGTPYRNLIAELGGAQGPAAEDESHEKSIEARTDVGPTVIEQLVQARRGQGVFRANIRLHEHQCRVTLVRDPAHLRASHIKPWRLSDDREKLDGNNGLLLAPHVDHLFDKGWISFVDNGDLLISPYLDRSVLAAWSIRDDRNVGAFSAEQSAFLNFHREHVFRHG